MLVSQAAPAGPAPEVHDRALVALLAAKVQTFREVALHTNASSEPGLAGCTYLRTHPDAAFGPAIAVLPALLIELVDRFRPELVSLDATLASLHPDASLLRQWAAAEHPALAQMLLFDNHGKPLNLCSVVTVLRQNTLNAEQVEQVLGISATRVTPLFSTANQRQSKVLAALDTRMRAFFVSAGLSAAETATLTQTQ